MPACLCHPVLVQIIDSNDMYYSVSRRTVSEDTSVTTEELVTDWTVVPVSSMPPERCLHAAVSPSPSNSQCRALSFNSFSDAQENLMSEGKAKLTVSDMSCHAVRRSNIGVHIHSSGRV